MGCFGVETYSDCRLSIRCTVFVEKSTLNCRLSTRCAIFVEKPWVRCDEGMPVESAMTEDAYFRWRRQGNYPK